MAHPGGRQLDRKWDPVELGADPVDQLQATSVDIEVRDGRGGPSEEQITGLSGIGSHRRNPPDALALGSERLATRRQDRAVLPGHGSAPH